MTDEMSEWRDTFHRLLVENGLTEYITQNNNASDINREHAEFHLEIIGPRDEYCIITKDYKAEKGILTYWVKPDKVFEIAREANNKNQICWISLNDKEHDKDLMEGVKALSVFYTDIDARPKGTKDRLATKEELETAYQTAQTFKSYIENEYAAIGFLAYSGNGFHVFFPLPITPLLGADYRKLVNEKLKAFTKQICTKKNIVVDAIDYLRRVTTLIGSYNFKIPEQPIQTKWRFEAENDYQNRKEVIAHARALNGEVLLKAILETEITKAQTQTTNIAKDHPGLEKLLKMDTKLNDMFNGNFQQHTGDNDRSEAEMKVVCSLLGYGFSDQEICDVMQSCKIGKWQEKKESYYEVTLKNAHKWINEQKAKEQPPQQQAKQEKTAQVLEHINAIENSELIEQPIQVEGVISSTSIAYPTPQEIKLVEIIKTEEGETDYIDNTALFKSDNPLNLSLVGVTKETQIARLKNYFLPKKVIITDVLKYRIIYMIRIRPPVFTLEKQGDKIVDEKGYEYKYLDLYVTSNKPLTFEPSTLVRITGLPLPHPRTQKTTILAYNVEFPESNFSYDTEKMSLLKTVFAEKTVKERLNWILENFELYSHIVGRKNIAKATLLTYFSPLYIKINGDTQRGWVITAIIGDTTTGKSETVKKFSKLLKAGSVISAETASTVGLTGTATQLDREGWFIDWGFLPLMDRKLLAIDGSHKLNASSWAALAEAERSGVLSIAKAAKNTTYARTRQLRIYNAVDQEADKYSTKSLSCFLYPIQALTTVLDKTSIARQDLAVFSDQRDVSPEIINKKIDQTPDQHLEILSEVLKWTWNTKTTIEWTEEAVTTLLNEATNLYKKFFYEAIPLVSIDQKYKIARLSVALAYCTLSTNDNFSVVTVTEEHVKTIVEFLTNEYTQAGLGLLSQEQQFEKLEEADVRQIFLRILEKVNLSNLHDILHFIVTSNKITKDTLKTKFDLTEKTELRPLLSVLQYEGLIKTGKGGFYPTTSLIEAFKLTDGFATLATLATPKNTPPSPPKLGDY